VSRSAIAPEEGAEDIRWVGLASGERCPRNLAETSSSARGPLKRVTATAESPGAVIPATIVSFATYAPRVHLGSPVARRTTTRL
jgi:hypothetical protein